jgi:hypothetical protein
VAQFYTRFLANLYAFFVRFINILAFPLPGAISWQYKPHLTSAQQEDTRFGHRFGKKYSEIVTSAQQENTLIGFGHRFGKMYKTRVYPGVAVMPYI